MTDFEQPESYVFIDDGRLPEEQPGAIFDMSHGCRMTDSVRRAFESHESAEDPHFVKKIDVNMMEDESREVLAKAAVFGQTAVAVATAGSERMSLSVKLANAAREFGSPGFADKLKVELEKGEA